ncbi:hypothetical protein P692DRAFT_20692797, partial [Suillus brevipes Sb2]
SPHRRITLTKIADLLGIHRNTLCRYLKKHNVYRHFSTILNHNLDVLVKVFKTQKPDSGRRYLIGFLRAHGVCIQRSHVQSSLRRVD